MPFIKYMHCILLLITAKRKNLYLHIGRLLAISLCNGGGAGRCLSPCIFDYIVGCRSATQPAVDDVAQPEIRKLLVEVSKYIYIIWVSVRVGM